MSRTKKPAKEPNTEDMQAELQAMIAKGKKEGMIRAADLNAQLEKVYREHVIPAVKMGLCASVYTQISDVEDEINGLLTYDRRVEKLQPEVMLPVAAS
mgnify:CR=1 FL=1